MNTPRSVSNIQELVMEICSDLFHTGRMVTRDRLHSAIDIVEMLFEKTLTYSGTINKNRKGLLTEIKTVKERENESSVFFWKKDSLVMLVSYVPTPHLAKICCLSLQGMKILTYALNFTRK